MKEGLIKKSNYFILSIILFIISLAVREYYAFDMFSSVVLLCFALFFFGIAMFYIYRFKCEKCQSNISGHIQEFGLLGKFRKPTMNYCPYCGCKIE